MSADQSNRITQFLEQHDKELLLAWVEHQLQDLHANLELVTG